MRIRQAKFAVHQVNRNGDGNGRHHPCGQDKEQQVILQRHLETAEGIGRQRAKDDRQRRRPKTDDDRIHEPLTKPAWARDNGALAASDLFHQAIRSWQGFQLGYSRAGACGEKVDITFNRGFKEHLRRVRNGVRPGFETGGDDPDQRQQRDDGVQTNQQTRDPFR